MKIIFTILCSMIITSLFAQSGWVKEKNKAYAQLSFNTLQSDQYYTVEGNKLKTSAFSQRNINVYGEYGLGNNLALQLNYTAFRWNAFSTTERVSGGGDAFIGIQYAILKKKFPLSITVGPEIPIGDADIRAFNKEIPDNFVNLPTGDGEWNFLSTLAISHAPSGTPIYFSAHTTFNLRTSYQGSNFSNQLRGGAEVGYKLFEPLWLQIKISVFKSLGEPTAGVDIVRSEGTSYTSIGFASSYNFYKAFSLVANLAYYNSWLVEQRNIYSAPSYTIGIAYKLE